MDGDKYCMLCNNGECVLQIKDYPKWANVAGCRVIKDQTLRSQLNTESEQS